MYLVYSASEYPYYCFDNTSLISLQGPKNQGYVWEHHLMVVSVSGSFWAAKLLVRPRVI